MTPTTGWPSSAASIDGRPALIERPSPNHDARAGGATVDCLVLHYTGMATAAAALARLCDPAAKVSAHYVVDEDGAVYALVPEERRAWHAGESSWAGESDVNSRSVGIELVNPGHEFGYRPFPEAQMAALEELCLGVLSRHAVRPARVLAHSDVAPARRLDPGELFDWARLARAGIGMWPEPGFAAPGAGGEALDAAPFRENLGRYGYSLAPGAVFDEDTRLVTAAFQRHFRPRVHDGAADAETVALLNHLLGLSSGS